MEKKAHTFWRRWWVSIYWRPAIGFQHCKWVVRYLLQASPSSHLHLPHKASLSIFRTLLSLFIFFRRICCMHICIQLSFGFQSWSWFHLSWGWSCALKVKPLQVWSRACNNDGVQVSSTLDLIWTQSIYILFGECLLLQPQCCRFKSCYPYKK